VSVSWSGWRSVLRGDLVTDPEILIRKEINGFFATVSGD